MNISPNYNINMKTITPNFGSFTTNGFVNPILSTELQLNKRFRKIVKDANKMNLDIELTRKNSRNQLPANTHFLNIVPKGEKSTDNHHYCRIAYTSDLLQIDDFVKYAERMWQGAKNALERDLILW